MGLLFALLHTISQWLNSEEYLKGSISMKISTDLEQVKAVASAMLYMDVAKTEFSPIIVQHPFTSSGMVVARKDGAIQMLDITANEENLAAWQASVNAVIQQSTGAFDIYMMVNKPYALTFLKYAAPALSRKDFSKILANAWMRSENPNNDPNVSTSKLLSMFKSADPRILMTPEEHKELSTLEDPITIYRGLTSYNADNVHAMSWTLDEKVATWFANRFGEHGTVYKAQIEKAHVLALFLGRGESEVVVDPRYLIEPSPVEDMTPGMEMS